MVAGGTGAGGPSMAPVCGARACCCAAANRGAAARRRAHSTSATAGPAVHTALTVILLSEPTRGEIGLSLLMSTGGDRSTS